MDKTKTTGDRKMNTHIGQTIGIAIVCLVAGGAAALFLQSPTKDALAPETTDVPAFISSQRDVATASTDPLPPAQGLSNDQYQAAVNATQPTAAGSVSSVAIKITSPAEGATITGSTPITANVTDPDNKVHGVKFEVFNDRYHYAVTWDTVTSAPYRLEPNLNLYPSGEYRYVVMAVDGSGAVLDSTDVMVTFAHSCYFVAGPTVTLSSPSGSIQPGTSFALTALVKNNIRGDCANVYDLSPVLPDGWTASFSLETPIALGLGQTKSVSMTVNVPATAQVSSGYRVGMKVTRTNTQITTTTSVPVSLSSTTTH